MSLVVVTGAALLMGFRCGAGPLAWLAVAGILLLLLYHRRISSPASWRGLRLARAKGVC